MADQKISELNAITGANTADDDLFVIVDTSTNETKKIAKSELVSTINAALVDGAPTTLDTLNELAAALNDDANFATTVTNSLAGKVDTSGDSMTGNLTFGDNDKAIFGAGSDLQIWSNGDTSYIVESSTTGNLEIRATDVYIKSGDNAKVSAVFDSDGQSKLYYDGSPKLATTSTGIDVTGTATMDGLTVDGATRVNDSEFLIADNNTAHTAKLSMDIDTTNGARIRTSINGTATVQPLGIYTGSTLRQKYDTNGDISFYEDTGTTAKFFWDASAESLGIGTTTPTNKVQIVPTADPSSSSSGAQIKLSEYTNNASYALHIGYGNIGGAGHRASLQSISGGSGSTLTLNESGGNVGIGTSSPSSALDIIGSSGGAVQATISDGAFQGSLQLSKSAGFYGLKAGSDYGGLLLFSNSSAERMRIDSSGNLLVGKTTLNGMSGAGIELRSGGQLYASAADGSYIGRRTTDGNILTFFKDTTTVGSIGVDANDNLYLAGATGNTKGIYLNDSGVMPATTSGSAIDNAVNLGAGSVRFKDLYLSGGVYLGGTGSANHLDDYEEGEWTPTFVGSTGGTVTLSSTFDTASYTKIGRLVTIMGRLDVASVSGLSGNLLMQDLPFTSGNLTDAAGYSVQYGFITIGTTTTGNPIIIEIAEGTTTATLRQPDWNSAIGILRDTSRIQFSLTYFTA